MSKASKTITYFELFPGAQITAKVNEDRDIYLVIDAEQVRQFVLYCHDAAIKVKWAEVQHRSLIKNTVILFLDGLDKTRYKLHSKLLPTFAKLTENGFPLTIVAHEHGGYITPTKNAFFGFSDVHKERRSFPSYEEMLISYRKMYDNGYPLPPTPETELLKRPLRCEKYDIHPLDEITMRMYSELPDDFEGALPIIALDCEMILTENGDELARLSVTNEKGEEVLNEFFKPMAKIIDLRFTKSGITEEMVANATHNSNEGCSVLGTIASKKTIIVGHSLENDLRALHVIHERCIDTSLLYNADRPYPQKPALAYLYKKYLKGSFREEVDQRGHDSTEDARAAMDLAKLALTAPVNQTEVAPTTPKLIEGLLKAVSSCQVFAQPGTVRFTDVDRLTVNISDDCAEKMVQSFQQASVTIGVFQSLSRCNIDSEEEIAACKYYEHILSETLANLPKQTMLIVYTGNGNFTRLRSTTSNQPPGNDPARKAEFEACREGMLWVHATET